jgi:hypothetical protein
MNNIELLNQVQAFLIAQANEKGINLADSFPTVQAFKDFVVGIAFKGLVDAGASVEQSFDATLGDGKYQSTLASCNAATDETLG